ncbi:DUF1304 domain-containing protein [Xinfangfangia pollutisoli]|uniref:DUF1304 domain-containing protein n=1 Tax=Xinfangfangia pollutisoli TaxID=2865960 RepID=UPI001CD7EF5C|nr:DUF1304 domain-containing protein [Xinfangfangia pollutisoli]
MLTTILIALIAALHLWILVLEMVLWTHPAGRRAFGTSADFAEATKVLAANQGLYNGFLAAGLAWAAIAGPMGAGQGPALFFLICVLVAGVYGGLTANRRILAVQAAPAALALASWMAGL